MGIKTPVRLEQPEKWPFDLLVVDADGGEVLYERRYAHSSRDRTVAAVMAGVGHHPEQREEVREANRQQVEKLKFVVRSINCHADMLAALKMLRDADDAGVREGYSGTMGADQRAVVDAAIAKAEGAA